MFGLWVKLPRFAYLVKGVSCVSLHLDAAFVGEYNVIKPILVCVAGQGKLKPFWFVFIPNHLAVAGS